jgi:hypothetical protein
VLLVAVFASCTPKIKPTGTIKTESWEGNQTLDKVLDTISGLQEGGSGQKKFSIDSEFEAYVGDRSLSLKIQAQFDLENSASDELLIELTDIDTYTLLGGVYSKNQAVFVSAGGFKFTLNKVDVLNAIGQGFSQFFDMDLTSLITGLDLGGMDITTILGGVLFPSASVITESPVRGENGETIVTVNAAVDIDAVLSVVLGLVGMVNDLAKDSDLNLDINELLREFTGVPLISELDADGNIIVEGYDEKLKEYIGLKVLDASGNYVEGTPFQGSILSMRFVDGVLDVNGITLDGKYAKAGTVTNFGVILKQFEVSQRVISLNMPQFVSTFDLYSLRLTGYGELPDVGEIELSIDIRLDPEVAEQNQIVLEIVKRESRELVLAGYYYDGYIYLNLSQMDLPYVHLNATRMGVPYIQIEGVDLRAIMDGLVGDLTFINEYLSEKIAAGTDPSPSAVYDVSSAAGVTIDAQYIFGLLTSVLTADNGRLYLNFTDEVIAGILRDAGVDVVIDDAVGPIWADVPDSVKSAISEIGIDIAGLIGGLGEKVIGFVEGSGVDLVFSAFLNYEGELRPGIGLSVNTADGVWAYVDLFVKQFGDGDAVYVFPDNFDEYKKFDYSTISFTGTANLTSIGVVTYTLTVSNIGTNDFAISWVTYDVHGAVLMGVYFSNSTVYVDFGTQLSILGFNLSEMNLDRLQFSLDTSGVSGGSGASGSGAAASDLTLGDIIDYLDLVPYNSANGQASAALSNDSFVSIIGELVGPALIANLQAYLPPVSANAFADLFELYFSFNISYFEENLGIDADLQTLYFGTDPSRNINPAAVVTSEEAATYKTTDTLLNSVSITGTADFPGAEMKNLTFNLTASGVLDLDNLKFSLTATSATSPILAVYYDAATQKLYVDLGFVDIFGFNVLDMNIGKIVIENVDIASLFAEEAAGGSGSSSGAAASAITVDDIFGWITGGYLGGVITVATESGSFAQILSKIVSREIMQYIEAILPPAALGAVIDTISGEIGLTLDVALERISVKVQNVVFDAPAPATVRNESTYKPLTVEGFLENVVINGNGKLPGFGDVRYVLTVSKIYDADEAAITFETFDIYNNKNFSVYYIASEKTLYVDFGSLSFFAFDFEAFNITKLKLLNVFIDTAAIFEGSGGASGSGGAAIEDLTVDRIFELLYKEYNELTGQFNLSLGAVEFVDIITDLLGDTLYGQIGALIPATSAEVDWDTVNGLIGLSLKLNGGAGHKTEELALEVAGLYFGVDTDKPTAPEPAVKNDYKTLEKLFDSIQIFGEGYIPGAGDVNIEVNLRIDIEDTDNAEFSLIARRKTNGEVALGLYNVGSTLYANVTGFYIGEINVGEILTKKLVIEGVNLGDILAGVLKPILKDLEDVGGGSGSGGAASGDDTFSEIYEALRLELAVLNVKASASPTAINDVIKILLGYDLHLILDQIAPSIVIDVELMDAFNIGFDLALNYRYDGGAYVSNDFIAFRITGFRFSDFTSYKAILAADAEYKTIDDVLTDFALHARVALDLQVTLKDNYAPGNELNNFVNNLLGAVTDTDGSIKSYGTLGEVEIVYAEGLKLDYNIIADIAVDRNDISKTDILIELRAVTTRLATGEVQASRLILGFYVDDGIGYIDLSGLVGTSDYNVANGLRIALNEINILKLLDTLIPKTLEATGGAGGSASSSSSDAYIKVNLYTELITTIVALFSEQGVDDIFEDIDIISLDVDLNTLQVSGSIGLLLYEGNPQVLLNVKADIDLDQNTVSFGNFGTHKNLFVLFNAKYGLADLAGLLSILDNVLSNGNTQDMFAGSLLIQNRESIKTRKPDTNAGLGTGFGYYSDGRAVGTGQTSPVYIYKIREGYLSGSSDPIGAGYKDKYSGLNGKLGILIDVSYNFTIKIPTIYINGIGTVSSIVSLPELGFAKAQGDLDLAFFFALGETSLDVFARVGGKIGVIVELTHETARNGVNLGITVVGKQERWQSASIDPMYELLSLASIDTLNLRNIAGSILLKDTAKEVVTGTSGGPATEPLIKSTIITITASSVILDMTLNAGSLNESLELFQNDLLGGLAPGTTFDVGAPIGDRYVADAVWDGVSAMIIGFVVAEGARNPLEDLSTGAYGPSALTGPARLEAGNPFALDSLYDGDITGGGTSDYTPFHGADNSGKEDMQNFINALLPFPTLDADSTGNIKITFINGRLTTLNVSLLGVYTDNGLGVLVQEKLTLDLTLATAGLGLNQETEIGTLPTTVKYATIATYENVQATVQVKYAGGIERNEAIAWDFTPVREALAAGALEGKNTQFTICGVVSDTTYEVLANTSKKFEMTLYIIDGKVLDGNLAFSNDGTVYTVDPYDGSWQSAFPTTLILTFPIHAGGSGTVSFSTAVSRDLSGVTISLAGGTYAARFSWNGQTVANEVIVQASPVRTVVSTNVPATQFYVSNIGTAINSYDKASVTFNDGSVYDYSVSWDNNGGSMSQKYGVVNRIGTITLVGGISYTINQAVTFIALATNSVEYINSTSTTTPGYGALTIGTSVLWFYDVDGSLKSVTIGAIDGSSVRYMIGESASYIEVKNGTYYSGSHDDQQAGNLQITVNWSGYGNIIVPVALSLGAAWRYDGSFYIPRGDAGAYVDVSGNNNIYKKAINAGQILTAADMPKMVLRAAIFANINIENTSDQRMNTAAGNPELPINWNFSNLNINPAVTTTYHITGTLYNKNDNIQTVYCDVTVTV